MPLIENQEGVEKFLPEVSAAPAVMGERRQGRDHGITARVPPETGLDSPERDDEARLDPELGADLAQQIAVFGEFLLALLDARRRHHVGQVLLQGHGEFGLVPVMLDHPGNRRQPGKGGIERGLGDAPGKAFFMDSLEPGGEIGLGGAGARPPYPEPGEKQDRDDSEKF